MITPAEIQNRFLLEHLQKPHIVRKEKGNMILIEIDLIEHFEEIQKLLFYFEC